MQLSSKQSEAINFFFKKENIKSYDGVLDAGAVRSGKSFSGIQAFILYSQSLFSGIYEKKKKEAGSEIIQLITGNSSASIRNNVVRPIIDIFGYSNCEYRETKGELRVGDHLYRCIGASKIDSVAKLKGDTIANWYADEITTHHKDFVALAMTRLTIPFGKFFWNCNPESPYHYIHTDFVEQKAEKKIQYRHWTFSDNPSLTEEYKARMARQMHGVYYQRYILGQWCVADGVIYPDFEQQAHFISASDVPVCDYYVMGIDYGITNPMVFGYIGYKEHKGKVYEFVIDEYYHKDKRGSETDSYYLYQLNKFRAGKNIKYFIIDPSATSFINAMRADGIHNIRNADNAVQDGIQNHSKWLAERRVFVVKENCPNYCKEHGVYSWDTKAAERKGIDEPLKVDDHAMDAIARYPKQTLYPLRGKPRITSDFINYL